MKSLSHLLPYDIAAWLLPSLEVPMIDELPREIVPESQNLRALKQYLADLVTKGRDEVVHSLLSHPDLQDAMDYQILNTGALE
jgi:hypothetical protein